jgi:hypothetical protein
MKIATYNLLKGGAKQCHWVKMLEDQLIDLLLVQESYPHCQHLPPLLYPNKIASSVWEMVKRNGWGSAVVAKGGVLKPIKVPGFAGWVVGAEIHDAAWQKGFADPLLAFSIHAPTGGESYFREVNKLLDGIAKLTQGCNIILGGDFNLTISHWSGSERAVSKQDLAIQARLHDEFGLLNCWQTANPDQPLAQTLRWASNRAIAFHCDGLFVPQSWQSGLVACAVLNGAEWEQLSDHNPVVACFERLL